MIWQRKFKMEPNGFPSFAASDMHWLHWYPLLPSTSNFLHQKLWHKYKFGCSPPNICQGCCGNFQRHFRHLKSSKDQILQTWIKSCKLGSTLDLHTFTKNWKFPPWLRFLRLFATWIVENPPPPTVELPTFQDYQASRCCRKGMRNTQKIRNISQKTIRKCTATGILVLQKFCFLVCSLWWWNLQSTSVPFLLSLDFRCCQGMARWTNIEFEWNYSYDVPKNHSGIKRALS